MRLEKLAFDWASLQNNDGYSLMLVERNYESSR
jgi:hypothetical protein